MPALTLTLDDQADWLNNVRRVISPNHDARPGEATIDLLVIHGISLPPGEYGGGFIEQLFQNTLPPDAHPYFVDIAGMKVSSHLLVDRHGELTQFVPFSARAWHAGRSEFRGRVECNDYSIGIELEGCDDIPYTNAQYASLADVTRVLMAHWSAITKDHIVGHSDIAPGRKTDPGSAFDWETYFYLLDNQENNGERP